LQVEFIKKHQGLFSPNRYKVLYGGREGLKSWSIARALLIRGTQEQEPLRILCARELQKSIKDSVHKLLSDQISLLNLSDFYTVQQASIKGQNGTEFFFEGLKLNANQIKSYEGIDRVWVEEAQAVSRASWDYLIPTIRKEGSEIWVSFNPELYEDETYQRFVVNPPEGALVVKTSWRDNPWCNPELEKDRQALRNRSEDDYLNIWEGECRQVVQGAVYAKEMRDAQNNNHIISVPYNNQRPVNTFWDLGYSDYTSIWFVQKEGFEYRVIDFYQDRLQSIQHYVNALQSKGYIYDTDYLPHDARAKQIGTGKSVEETMQGLGRKVEIVPMLSISDGIFAARSVFPTCYFDKNKCADGLQALRHYKYETDNSKNPLHDDASHAADAFRYFAVAPHVQWNVNVESKGWGEQGKLHHEYNPYEEARL